MTLIGFETENTPQISPELQHKANLVLKTLQTVYRGKLKAVSSLSIEKSPRLSLSGAEVRAIIRHLRRAGYPIGSCGRGYFYCETKAELLDTIAHLESRKDSLEETIDALRVCYEKMLIEDQMIFAELEHDRLEDR